MKIQNDGAGALSNATDSVTRTKAQEQGGAGKAHSATSNADALKLSPEAQFLQTLAEQSSGDAAIRTNVVGRMKALLEAGRLGADSGALADALIDDLLKSR